MAKEMKLRSANTFPDRIASVSEVERRHYEGESYKAICADLGISDGTVYKYLRIAAAERERETRAVLNRAKFDWILAELVTNGDGSSLPLSEITMSANCNDLDI